MNNWTEQHLKSLKKQGKIRDYKVMNRNKEPNGKIVSKAFKKKSKEKEWIEMNLMHWCNEHCLQLQSEYKFHPERKFRFDWCIPSIKWACEYEGIFSEQSRHTNKIGYAKDAQKYREALKLGWKVFRYTAVDHKNLITDLNEYYDLFCSTGDNKE